jgi:hypothetical protein
MLMTIDEFLKAYTFDKSELDKIKRLLENVGVSIAGKQSDTSWVEVCIIALLKCEDKLNI